MEAKLPHFSEQFCRDIEREVVQDFEKFDARLRSDLQLYDTNGKLKFINSHQIEARENLEASDLKTWFSVNDIKADLKECLEKYFILQPISKATEVEYNDLIECGSCSFNIKILST